MVLLQWGVVRKGGSARFRGFSPKCVVQEVIIKKGGWERVFEGLEEGPELGVLKDRGGVGCVV